MKPEKKPSRISEIFRRAQAAMLARVPAKRNTAAAPLPVSSVPVLASSPAKPAIAPLAAKPAPKAAVATASGPKSSPLALPVTNSRPQNSGLISDSAIAAQYRGLKGTDKFNFYRANRAALKRESIRERSNGPRINFLARSVMRIFACGAEAKKAVPAALPPPGDVSLTAGGFKKRVLPCGRK